MNPWIAQDLARYRAEDVRRGADSRRLPSQNRQTRRIRKVGAHSTFGARVRITLVQVRRSLTAEPGPFTWRSGAGTRSLSTTPRTQWETGRGEIDRPES
jgi:hypothetical protein